MLFGIVCSPISLWLLTSNELSNESRPSRNRYFKMNATVTESSVLTSNKGSSKEIEIDTDLEVSDEKLVHVAVLSSSKSLHHLNRATAAYYSYGKNLGNAFQIYTFPTGVGKKRKNPTKDRVPVRYMKHLENSTEPKTHFIHLLDHFCQDASLLNYQFILILRDDTYIQVKNLHKFVRSLGHGSQPSYIGLRSKNGHCKVGTGILLRKFAFKQICHDLHQCTNTGTHGLSVSEDEILGTCFRKNT